MSRLFNKVTQVFINVKVDRVRTVLIMINSLPEVRIAFINDYEPSKWNLADL
jgi:hypothetical protein